MRLQLEQKRQERARWQQKSHQAAIKVSEEGVSQEDKDAHLTQSAQGQELQYKLLTKVMAIKLKGSLLDKH